MSNPIEKYRAAQRRIRRLFEPYTSVLCPVCPALCCRKPTKVAEFDVLLANAHGCNLQSANDSVVELVKAGMDALTGNLINKETFDPCDYIGPNGCLFPDDLRPFECVRFVCKYIKKEIRPGELRELRALLHRFATLHRELTAAVKSRK